MTLKKFKKLVESFSNGCQIDLQTGKETWDDDNEFIITVRDAKKLIKDINKKIKLGGEGGTK